MPDKNSVLDRRDERVNYFTGPSQWTGQYDDAYKPWRLRNYEIPKPYRPGTTISRPIVTLVNDFGQFKVGAPKSKKNLWGNYIPTWKYPKKITREFANHLTKIDRLYPEELDTCKATVKLKEKNEDRKIEELKDTEIKEKNENEFIEKGADITPKDVEMKPKAKLCPIHDV